ncbi:hypothetical protein [Sinomicrobium weinanense]|uniref:Uncharacterized protein n=1 Tax=Sinomicrobium weinanense TaxID=2842200 RepID=A0A926Q428_9FLAO|nr:hypothetical protein [Sinomicrobium weinanense]MBC9796631.1 hypothetical protein [Sinomicrobium weinanense]MBU3123845.1 hypothetical protein [Sinomicrobium weinanense]
MNQNLTKNECKQAIEAWKLSKADYSEIKNLISPTSVFHFDRKSCDWVNKHNKNKRFYTYIGVHDAQLVLIVVPLDKKGKEEDLSSYLAIPLTPLDKDLILLEKEETVSVKKITLSKHLKIKSVCEEVELPVYNEPAITESISLSEVEQWKDQCLDWFYHECTDYKGKRIFNTFTVPFADLIEGIEDHGVICLFALKNSDIYNRLIPVLIFVAVNSTTMQGQMMRSTINARGAETVSNTYDWSRPCPPFCREPPDEDLFS